MGFEQSDTKLETVERQQPFPFFPRITEELCSAANNQNDRELARKLSILASATDLQNIEPATAGAFLNLGLQELSQVLILSQEQKSRQFEPQQLDSIAMSPMGIRTEILLQYIEMHGGNNSERRLLLRKPEIQLLLERQVHFREKNNPKALERVENALKTAASFHQTNTTKQSPSDIQLQFDY